MTTKEPTTLSATVRGLDWTLTVDAQPKLFGSLWVKWLCWRLMKNRFSKESWHNLDWTFEALIAQLSKKLKLQRVHLELETDDGRVMGSMTNEF